MNDNDVLIAFGRRVRDERRRLGQSQEQLAHAAGLDRTYVSDVERGSRNIGLRNSAALAGALSLELADLLRPQPLEASQFQHEYRYDPAFALNCGFDVSGEDVIRAVLDSDVTLRALPARLFQTVDLKTQSGIVGAVFAASIAGRVGAIVNPIEKGHPDVVPTEAGSATEPELRNYHQGLEVKCTVGGVAKGSNLTNGAQRVDFLSTITWQAHHRGVRSLMGLVWDSVGGAEGAPAHPVITGVFFNDKLTEDDWGAISGTTGRNTKVTGMTRSGLTKMGAGAVAIINEERYIQRYERIFRGVGFSRMKALVSNSPEA